MLYDCMATPLFQPYSPLFYHHFHPPYLLPHMLKTALFDLDGVIIDTETQYSRFWQAIGHTYYPQLPDFALSIKGNTLTAIREKYFQDDTIFSHVEARLKEFEASMSYDVFPGVEEYLALLHTAGIPCAVVTSSNKQKMASLARQKPGLHLLFDRIFTAEDAGRGKPFPDCYLRAAEAMGTGIQECAVFEDSINGLKAARASGAFVVGLTTTHHAGIVSEWADLTFGGLHECPWPLIPDTESSRKVQ